jgi:hypothetical protein
VTEADTKARPEFKLVPLVEGLKSIFPVETGSPLEFLIIVNCHLGSSKMKLM